MKYLIILFFFLEITICKGQTRAITRVELDNIIQRKAKLDSIYNRDFLIKQLEDKIVRQEIIIKSYEEIIKGESTRCKETIYLFAEELEKELLKSLNKK